MIYSKGTIVKAIAGRDKGKLFTVIDSEGEQYSIIADGRTRRIEQPKKKSNKHLELFSKADPDVLELISQGRLTNSRLRKSIAKFEDKDANNQS